ncbi:MAG: class II glutamine amidotransferase [Nitrososphaerales archaeon]
MLGVIPSQDIDLSLLKSFRELASCGKVKQGSPPGHSDGWGAVAWHLDSPYYLAREPKDAHTDTIFDEMLLKIESSPITTHFIAHLRKASLGAKTRENTHPFIQGKWAFAHNGTIRKLNLKDRTDSEWFFLSLMKEAEEHGGDMLEAIKSQVQSVRALYNYSSITFLLSDGRSMFAYRDYSGHDDYYTLYYADTKRGFIVCQEKIIDADWIELSNHELLVLKEGSPPRAFQVPAVAANYA